MKKYFSISALALLSVLCFSTTFSSCNKDKDENPGGLIVGTWRSVANPSCREVYTFSSDGTGFYSKECKTDISSFTWFVIDDVLTIVWDNNKVERFTFDVNNGKVYLYDKDGNVYIYTKIKTDEDENSKPGDLVGTWRETDDDGDEECASLLTFYSNGKGLDGFACDGEISDEDTETFTWSVKGDILIMDGEAGLRFKIKGNKLYLYVIEDEEDYFVFEKVK